ncbi:MAG: ribosome maturation factor RimM [Cytophagaceae bacterium]|jgi:16S rRNA processing protein RimM|nr:ribosome maturation factor RimM [Cytophagaceae bacterium]
MLNKENFIQIGTLVKPHGIAGEIQIRMLPEMAEREVTITWLYVMIDGGLVPFKVIAARSKGNSLLLELDSVNSEDAAQKYRGCSVFINPDELLPEEEKDNFTLSRFIGYKVTDKTHGLLGFIKSIHDIQQNPLMEIEYQGKEILIPFQDEFIINFRKNKCEMDIETPPGLIDIFLE